MRDWRNILALTVWLLAVGVLIGIGISMAFANPARPGLDATWQPPATTVPEAERSGVTVVPSAPTATDTPVGATPALPPPTAAPTTTATPLTPSASGSLDGQEAEPPQAHFAVIVRLHSDPDLAAKTVALAQAGSTYTVTARTQDQAWWQVCCVNGQPAWVASQVVTVTGQTAAVAVK